MDMMLEKQSPNQRPVQELKLDLSYEKSPLLRQNCASPISQNLNLYDFIGPLLILKIITN